MKTADSVSKAETIFSLIETFWPIPEDTRLSPEDAVAGGRAVANNLFGAMVEAGLSAKDGMCALICAKGEESGGCAPFTPENQDVCDLEMQRLFLNGALEPVGVVFGILDREKKVFRLHCRGFEPSERNTRILSSAKSALETGDMSTPRCN
jgi:hypothetical protein